jgi:hypothetical protein
MTDSYANWPAVAPGTKIQFGDAVTFSDNKESGLVIGFMGKKRDQIIVRVTTDGESRTLTTSSQAITQVCRKPK